MKANLYSALYITPYL